MASILINTSRRSERKFCVCNFTTYFDTTIGFLEKDHLKTDCGGKIELQNPG
jgi:hypothetical protein